MPDQDWIREELQKTLRGGLKRLITAAGADSFPEIIPGEFSIQRHPQKEVLMVISGESDFALAGHKNQIVPGDTVLIDSWEPHSAYYRKNDRNLLHIWLHFHSPPIQAIIFYLNDSDTAPSNRLEVLYRFSLSNALTEVIISRWNSYEKMKKILSPAEAHSCLRTAFQLIFEELLIKLNSSAAVEKTPDNQMRIDFIKSYILHHNGRDCSLDILAKISGCSKYHLVHLFKQHTGKTPGDYIDEARINYTKNAIRHGLRNKEIADNLGFSSPSAFGNWKKKVMDTDYS